MCEWEYMCEWVRFWDNIVVSFTGSPSVFRGNPSAREEICVYQFGPEWSNSNSRRLTPDAANSRKVKIPLADLLAPHWLAPNCCFITVTSLSDSLLF